MLVWTARFSLCLVARFLLRCSVSLVFGVHTTGVLVFTVSAVIFYRRDGCSILWLSGSDLCKQSVQHACVPRCRPFESFSPRGLCPGTFGRRPFARMCLVRPWTPSCSMNPDAGWYTNTGCTVTPSLIRRCGGG